MPRSGSGGRGGGSGGSRGFSGGSRSRPYSTGRQVSPPPPPKPKSSQPSLLKQGAAIAGGVVAGNLIAAAILGSARESIPPGVECSENGTCRGIPDDDPCTMELKNFVECAYRAQEMTQCDGYNTLLKECRRYEERYSKQR